MFYLICFQLYTYEIHNYYPNEECIQLYTYGIMNAEFWFVGLHIIWSPKPEKIIFEPPTMKNYFWSAKFENFQQDGEDSAHSHLQDTKLNLEILIYTRKIDVMK